jgi:uncharacterized protein (DUF2249 family)
VRRLHKPDKHPVIVASYADLPVGGSSVLVNDHDPKHLPDEFEADHAGSCGWEYFEKSPAAPRIRIGKLTAAALPRMLAIADIAGADMDMHTGALLRPPRRSQQQFTAGPEGLRYPTVHQKQQVLPLNPTVRAVV